MGFNTRNEKTTFHILKLNVVAEKVIIDGKEYIRENGIGEFVGYTFDMEHNPNFELPPNHEPMLGEIKLIIPEDIKKEI